MYYDPYKWRVMVTGAYADGIPWKRDKSDYEYFPLKGSYCNIEIKGTATISGWPVRYVMRGYVNIQNNKPKEGKVTEFHSDY